MHSQAPNCFPDESQQEVVASQLVDPVAKVPMSFRAKRSGREGGGWVGMENGSFHDGPPSSSFTVIDAFANGCRNARCVCSLT